MLTAASAALAVTMLTGCDALKSAMNSHVDVAASVGSQELSVGRLAEFLSAIDYPADTTVASAVANAWIDYQLLGQQAASGDTIIEKKVVDQAMWSAISQIKARMLYDKVSASWGSADSAEARSLFDSGELIAGSHILFVTREKSDAEKVQAKKNAEAALPNINAGNFAAMAGKYSEEPGAAARGGSLGVFKRGDMVPEFEQGILALKPGEVSKIVESPFGYHIIYRATFDQVKDEAMGKGAEASVRKKEKEFIEGLQAAGKLEMKDGIAPIVREVMNDPMSNLDNKKVLATSAAGKFTAARLAEWLQIMPPQMVMQQKMMLESAPDSMVSQFIKNFATNDLVIYSADTAKLGPSEEELEGIRHQFFEARSQAWMQLGVTPFFLADSNRTVKEREALAASRVDKYIENFITGKAPPVDLPPQVAAALRKKKKTNLNNQALAKAVEQALLLKASKDSTENAVQTPSVIPMPGDSASE